ncbi:MAG: glycosyltransferase family 4 protein [Bacteroidales bacterium]|nr:glycosyltransferase family 4 protein [Bacteroidales bacterium]
MKLLLLGNNSIHTYNFYQLIRDYFDEILVLTDKKEGACEGLPIQVIDYAATPLKMFKAYRQTRRIIHEFQPDIIHGQQVNKALWFAVKAKGRIPVVSTAWGSDILVMPRKNILYKKVVQYVLSNSDYLTSDSAYMAEEMQRLARCKHDIVIANFGIEPHKPTADKADIIYSNRLHEKLYRIEAVIRAFAPFNSKHKNWRLVIGATGSETDHLKSLAKELGIEKQVDFVGWLDEPTNFLYYSQAKIWVSIPESDATSISLLEAMSMGCVPVVSDLPANREWISDGYNGLIVKDVDTNFFSEAIQKINAAEAAEHNRKIVAENATKEANRKKFIAIYDKIFADLPQKEGQNY